MRTAALVGLAAILGFSPANAFKVGLVFDVGGRGDKSFNDSAYRGLERAKKELGVETEFVEPNEPSDRENALRRFANAGCDIVIGIGFLFTDDINRVAAAFPKIPFAGVDYSLAPGAKPRPTFSLCAFASRNLLSCAASSRR